MKMDFYQYQSMEQDKKDIENLCKEIETKEYVKVQIKEQTEVLKWAVKYLKKAAKNSTSKEYAKNEITRYIKRFLILIEHPNYKEFCIEEALGVLYKDKEKLKLAVDNYIKNYTKTDRKKEYIEESPEKNLDLAIKFCVNEIKQMNFLKNEDFVDVRKKIIDGTLTSADSENLYLLCEKVVAEKAKNYKLLFEKKVQEHPEIIYLSILRKFDEIFVVEDNTSNINDTKPESEFDISEKIANMENLNNMQNLANNILNLPVEKISNVKNIKVANLVESPTYTNNDKDNAILWIYKNLLTTNDKNLMQQVYHFFEFVKECPKEKKEEAKNAFLKIIRRANDSIRRYDVKDVFLDRAFRTYNLLDNINSIEDANNLNNERLKKLNFEDLQIEKEELEKLFEGLFNNTMVSKESSIALSAFYINRAAKIVPAYLRATFILEKNGVFDKIYENPDMEFEDLNLDNKTIMQNMAEYDALANLLESKRRKIKKDDKEIGKKLSDAIIKYSDTYEEKYGNFVKDTVNVLANYSDKQLFYKKKDELISELIYIATKKEKNKIINWGYIKNDENEDDSKVLLGFDIQYMNTPLFFHINKKFLQQKLMQITGKQVLPVYQGNRDMEYFVYDGKKFDNGRFTTQILYPFDKKRRRALLKNTEKKLNSIRIHLKWLQNPNATPAGFSNEAKYYFDLEKGTMLKNQPNQDCSDLNR